MKKLMLLIVVLLAGCVAQPVRDNSNNSAARQRAKLHTELAADYFARGERAVALEEYNEAIRIDPGYAPAYGGLALLRASLRQDEMAEANFKRALQLDPESSEEHNNFGTFLCSRNRIDESITEFMAAVKDPLYPTPEMAYLNAGICALKKKDARNAETYLNNALQLQPELRQASYQLANLHYQQGDLLQARKHLERAMLGIDPPPDMLWLGIRIERVLGGKDAEASYSVLLRNKYPDSEQAKALLAE